MAKTSFEHSTPQLYDRFMGPLLFTPYARLVAERVRDLQPSDILETAAGTGIVTQAVHAAAPHARLVATDINPSMLQLAAQHIRSELVSFQTADAQALPFAENSFDLVICQFGIMFFPDRVAANREARRVLKPGGRYLLVVFDRVESNPVPRAAGEAVAAMFPEDPPSYMEQGPFSYADPARIAHDLRAAGFADVELDTVSLSSRVDARDAAKGMVLGSPLRAVIEQRDPSALQQAEDRVAEALAQWDGKDAPMSAHVAVATR